MRSLRRIRPTRRSSTGTPTPRRTAAVSLAAALALTSLTGCADEVSNTGSGSDAKGGANGKLKIMVGGLDKVIYLPAMLTQRLGYFKDEGLDVQLLTEPAGVQATTSLVSGDVQAVVGFYDHTMDLQAKGKHIESVVQLAQTPGEVELVSKKAKGLSSPKDFSGRKLGVTGLGSSTDFLTKYLAVDAGLDSGSFTPVAVGAGQTFISAFQKGSIDGGMTTEPTVSQVLEKKLGEVLVDMRTPQGSKKALGGLYPSSSLYMQKEWVEQHKPTVQKLANAMVRTLAWIDTHSAQQIAAKMPPDYAQGGKELYAKAIGSTLPMFTSDGVMPKDGPKTVERVLKSFNPNVKNTDIELEETYTTEFAKQAAKTAKSAK